MLKKLIISVFLIAALPMLAYADIVPVAAAYWTGFRSTATGGVTGINEWSASEGGFRISWNISYDGGSKLWSYSYTFADADGSALNPNLSHWILEVSSFITEDNVGETN